VVDDILLGAYVDGELDPTLRAAVERAVAADPAVTARLVSILRITAAVRAARTLLRPQMGRPGTSNR